MRCKTDHFCGRVRVFRSDVFLKSGLGKAHSATERTGKCLWLFNRNRFSPVIYICKSVFFTYVAIEQRARHTEITSCKYALHRMIGCMSRRSDPRLVTSGAQVIVEAYQTLISFTPEVAFKARITAHS